uniref:RRM domain-containing protein n=1 Tax=Chenopodium quinoa TaxID=63459 RepID=A0A803LS47_CHEQI
MAAAATASTTVQSSLSTPKPSFAFLTNKQLPSDPIQVKFGSTKKSYSPLISQHYCFTNESTPIACVSHKRRAPRIAAAVTEEEVVETAGDLYFGNLPYHCDSAQLAGIVQEYGTPELVEVLYNRDTGKSRGFAFVTMSSVEDCNAVIENLDGSEYGGRYLRVNFADNPRKREPLFPETDHKLFVGNLSWSVTSDSLYQAFQEYGKVVGARVLFDGETGIRRPTNASKLGRREEIIGEGHGANYPFLLCCEKKKQGDERRSSPAFESSGSPGVWCSRLREY